MTDINKHLNKVTRKVGIKQKGHIRVMSKIVRDLSSGIYSTPANCIKEIINNAFDADAKKVIVRAKPTLDLFSITDNGCGMTLEDFCEKFSVISKSYKRIESDVTKELERPLVGKIGIGFIAVSEICDKMMVVSTKKGDEGTIKVEIDFKKFKDEDEESNDEFYKKSEYELVYEVRKEDKDEQYTKVILTELTEDFKQILLDRDYVEKEKIMSGQLEDKTFEEVVEHLQNKNIGTYEKVGEYWKLLLDVARTVPVSYLENGPVKREKKFAEIEKIKKDIVSFDFSVDFDGMELKKPFLLPNNKKISQYGRHYVVHTFKKEITIENELLSFRGYFYANHGGISPKEDSGLLIRIKNVKVGEIDSTYLNYPFFTNQVFRHWVFGEIYVDSGLEDAMNIDRNSFRVTHRHYRELKKFVHNYLHKKVFPYCLHDFYEVGKKERDSQKKKVQKKKIQNAVNLESANDKPVKIQMKEEKLGPPVEIDLKDSSVVIRSKAPIFKNYSRVEKEFLQELLVIFESSYKKAKRKKLSIDEFKKLFYDSLGSREK